MPRRLVPGDAVGEDPPRGFEAVELGHPDVHQDDVRSQRANLVDRVAAVGRLADDLDLRLGVEDHPEAGADERLVVDEQNADHDRASAGSCARSTKPPPSRGPVSSVPPYNATRSRIPTRPAPSSVRSRWHRGAVVGDLELDAVAGVADDHLGVRRLSRA